MSQPITQGNWNARLREYILPFVLMTIVMLLTFTPAITPELSRKDEDNFVLTTAGTGRIHPQLVNVAKYESLHNFLIASEITVGRFRPFYQLLVLIEAKLLNGNLLLLHIETIIIGILTLYGLFRAARLMGLSLAAALVLVLWMIVGSDGKIWWETMIAEEPAMLLCAFSLYAIVRAAKQGVARGWDAVALVTMLLAGFIKETFILIIPASVLLRLVLTYYWHPLTLPQVFRRHALFIGVMALICLAQTAGALSLYLRGGYGTAIAGVAGSGTSRLGGMLDLARDIAPTLLYSLPTLGVLAYLRDFRANPRLRWVLFGGLLVYFGWIVPQFFIYSNSGNFERHYVYPVLVALVVGNCLGLTALERWLHQWFTAQHRPQFARWAALAPSLGVVLLIGGGLGEVSAFASRHTAESEVLARSMRLMSAELESPDDQIVVVMRPRIGLITYSRLWLGRNGMSNTVNTHFIAVKGNDAAEKDRFSQPGYAGGIGYDEATFDPIQACCIALWIEPEYFAQFPPLWFQPDEWTLHTVSAPVWQLTLVGYRQIDTLRYDVYIRHP